MNHLYIISGKANTGKTHTCWLLYTMLSCLGEVKLFENLGFPNALPKSLTKILYDAAHEQGVDDEDHEEK